MLLAADQPHHKIYHIGFTDFRPIARTLMRLQLRGRVSDVTVAKVGSLQVSHFLASILSMDRSMKRYTLRRINIDCSSTKPPTLLSSVDKLEHRDFIILLHSSLPQS